MGLPRLAVQRPVATVMVLGIVLLTGLIALAGIPVDLLPELSFPIIAVITRYPGAGPREVENLVTRPLEEAIAVANNLRAVSSESMEGVSVVVARYEWGTNMDTAALDIREKIDLVRRFLPAEVDAPTVVKADPSLLPMMQVALSGPADLMELTRLGEDVIKDRLERVAGVASVTVLGGVRREIAVLADPARLDGLGLSLGQLAQALRLENLSLPGGEVEEAGRRLVIRTVGEFQALDEIAGVSLRTPLGGTVRLADVARVEDTASPPQSLARLNGKPSVSLAIQKRSGSNTVQVARGVHAALRQLRKELPPGVELAVAVDQSAFILRSVRAMGQSAATGALLAILVLLAFLQDLRSTLVIAAAIPVSV
ncbi:MAG: efflux RND transporter permease subunit, partial [bacterium]|nr:efflux RND transporter permease subunit [bacterium]